MSPEWTTLRNTSKVDIVSSVAWAGPEAAEHPSRRLRPVRGRRFRDLEDRAWERRCAHAVERSGR